VEAPVAHLGSADDYAIDHINFDPTNPASIIDWKKKETWNCMVFESSADSD
jgi:hypothetical protein